MNTASKALGAACKPSLEEASSLASGDSPVCCPGAALRGIIAALALAAIAMAILLYGARSNVDRVGVALVTCLVFAVALRIGLILADLMQRARLATRRLPGVQSR